MALSQAAKEAIYRELKSLRRRNSGMTTWQTHCFLKRLRIPSSTSEVSGYMRRAYESKEVRIKGRPRKMWMWRRIDGLEEATLPKFTTFIAETAKKYD